ncbi:conjugal transfer protein [Streptomyces sp. SM12]|uniref:conjugal transfer protein n=1 Tax=Streptomyces sp. SM12 TaxID=1071602 RepID=UPI000CD553B7|nr:conjugal transfer protein [Streptomyces sp. SM12]
MRRRTQEEAEPEEWEAPGWDEAKPSSGARALLTSGIRTVVWAGWVASPVLALAALATASSSPVPVVQEQEQPDGGSGDDIGPAGFAELVAAAYIEAGPDGGVGTLTAVLPGADPAHWRGIGGAQQVEQAAAVQVDRVDEAGWVVTVAARVVELLPEEEGEDDVRVVLRHLRVPVVADSEGRLVAAALPAEVAAPGLAAGVDLGFERVSLLDGDPALGTVRDFLGAYLSDGDVDRYLSPGADAVAVDPPPYVEVSVSEVSVSGEVPRAGELLPVPASGEQRLLVEVQARTAGGLVRPLVYALVLMERDGRWEIAAVDAAPARTQMEVAQ